MPDPTTIIERANELIVGDIREALDSIEASLGDWLVTVGLGLHGPDWEGQEDYSQPAMLVDAAACLRLWLQDKGEGHE